MNNVDMKADISCEKTKTRKIVRRIIKYLLWFGAIICVIIGFDSDVSSHLYYNEKNIFWYDFEIMHKAYWYDEPDWNTTNLYGTDIFKMILSICIILLLPLICDFIFKLIFNAYQNYICKNSFLTVNGEKVEGAYLRLGIFKKSFTFPIEQIVNIVTLDSFVDRLRSGKTLVLHTSSGKIKFSFVQNAEEISSVILNAVKEYKENYGTIKQIVQKTTSTANEIEKLKQYKELLDSGVINQEEFEAKKKELLNL